MQWMSIEMICIWRFLSYCMYSMCVYIYDIYYEKTMGVFHTKNCWPLHPTFLPYNESRRGLGASTSECKAWDIIHQRNTEPYLPTHKKQCLSGSALLMAPLPVARFCNYAAGITFRSEQCCEHRIPAPFSPSLGRALVGSARRMSNIFNFEALSWNCTFLAPSS